MTYFYLPPEDRLLQNQIEISNQDLSSFLERKNQKEPISNSEEFSGILSDTLEKNEHKTSCADLQPLDCKFKHQTPEQGRKSLEENLARTIRNITKANEPGYREELEIKDENGNYLKSSEPGILEKTQWPLDFAITGSGRGLKLQNGQYTTDGRFKFNQNGQIVSLKEDIPLEIEFKDPSKQDLSTRQLEVNFRGLIKDKVTGAELGKIKFEGTRIFQGYLEKPKINVPIALMELSQSLRSMSLIREAEGLGARSTSQFIDSLRSL